jgi:hypothetical protein
MCRHGQLHSRLRNRVDAAANWARARHGTSGRLPGRQGCETSSTYSLFLWRVTIPLQVEIGHVATSSVPSTLLRIVTRPAGMNERAPPEIVPEYASRSVDEVVDFVLQGRDQPAASRPRTFALLAAQSGVRRMLNSEYEDRTAFDTFHAIEEDFNPVLRVFGVRKSSTATGLLHHCHVTMVCQLSLNSGRLPCTLADCLDGTLLCRKAAGC